MKKAATIKAMEITRIFCGHPKYRGEKKTFIQ